MMILEAVQLHEQGNLTGAASIYKKILEKEPNNADALNLLGVVYMQSGKLSEAISLIEKAISIKAFDPRYYNNLGQAYSSVGRDPESLECYKKAIKINRQDPGFHNNMALALQNLGDLRGSQRAFKKALSLKSRDPNIYHNYGVLLQLMGDFETAITAHKKSIDQDSSSEYSFGSLAAALIEIGKVSDGIKAYEQAIAINPLYVEAHEGLKTYFWSIGRRELIHNSYRLACQTLPNSAQAHYNCGSALFGSGELEEALNSFKRATQLDGNYAAAYDKMACIFAGLEKFDEALENHKKSINIEKDNFLYHGNLARTLMFMGNFIASKTSLSNGYHLNPRRSSILANMSICLNELGELEELRTFVDYDKFVTSHFIKVPDGFSSLKEFNNKLHRELEKLHRPTEVPFGQTMRGGTQISGNLFAHPKGVVGQLKTKIIEVLKDYLSSLNGDAGHPFLRYINMDCRFTGAWSTILKREGFDGNHIHEEGWISGVYYVKVPGIVERNKIGEEGCIQFGEPPSRFISGLNKTQKLIRPEIGKVIFFPSYYWHGVRSFNGPGQRHSISFDLI